MALENIPLKPQRQPSLEPLATCQTTQTIHIAHSILEETDLAAEALTHYHAD